MKIRVLFFAALAQQAGLRETELELPTGATVDQALDALQVRYPALGPARGKLATAVDMSYVKGGHPLEAGQELALIPPVSGG